MMWKRWVPALLLALSGCAHFGASPADVLERSRLWEQAQTLLAAEDFERADSIFAAVAWSYPDTDEGRESLFYRGMIALNPANPGWNSEEAERHMQAYLASADEGGIIHRRPEAESFFALASQLNLPMDERIPELQARPQTRVIIQAREAEATVSENTRLTQEITACRAESQQLKEEMDRIRRTLTGGQ